MVLHGDPLRAVETSERDLVSRRVGVAARAALRLGAEEQLELEQRDGLGDEGRLLVGLAVAEGG